MLGTAGALSRSFPHPESGGSCAGAHVIPPVRSPAHAVLASGSSPAAGLLVPWRRAGAPRLWLAAEGRWSGCAHRDRGAYLAAEERGSGLRRRRSYCGIGASIAGPAASRVTWRWSAPIRASAAAGRHARPAAATAAPQTAHQLRSSATSAGRGSGPGALTALVQSSAVAVIHIRNVTG